MTVKARGASWQATVHFKGQRYRKDFVKEAEALVWEAKTLLTLRQGGTVEGAGKGAADRDARTIEIVLAKAKSLHWDRMKGSGRTVMNAQVFVKWVGEKSTPAKALSQNTIDRFVTHLIEDRRVGNSTINKYMSAIAGLVERAELEKKPKLPWYKPGQGRVRYFSDEEERAILNLWTQWKEDDAVRLFSFLLDTGARPWSEALTLNWRNVFDNQRKVIFDDTKNDLTRQVPLTARALAACRAGDKSAGGPFAGINPDHMQRLWNRTQNRLPQLADAVIYTARHTCASRLAMKGFDLLRIKTWMGHKSIQTTLIYAHLMPSALDDMASALEPVRPSFTVVT